MTKKTTKLTPSQPHPLANSAKKMGIDIENLPGRGYFFTAKTAKGKVGMQCKDDRKHKHIECPCCHTDDRKHISKKINNPSLANMSEREADGGNFSSTYDDDVFININPNLGTRVITQGKGKDMREMFGREEVPGGPAYKYSCSNCNSEFFTISLIEEKKRIKKEQNDAYHEKIVQTLQKFMVSVSETRKKEDTEDSRKVLKYSQMPCMTPMKEGYGSVSTLLASTFILVILFFLNF